MTDAITFLNALAVGLPDDERLILCGFVGDPNQAGSREWRPRPWRPGEHIPFGEACNGYVAISSYKKSPDGTWRRKQETFAAGRALMIDDVGVLDGTNTARVDVNSIRFRPSAIIETSPNNFHYWYLLREPLGDQEKLKGLVEAFIAKKLAGKDPGMAGANRVGRLPGFANTKKKYGGFTTRLVELNDRRFTVEHLLTAFNLKIAPPPKLVPPKPGEEAVRRAAYETVERWLRRHDNLLRNRPDMSGWTDMRCPWIDNHSDRANTGAAIHQPARENGMTGAFRCHHAGCADKHWRELNDYIDDLRDEEMAERNRDAGRRGLPPAQRGSKKKTAGLGVESRTGGK
jgi:hypothetical protein